MHGSCENSKKLQVFHVTMIEGAGQWKFKPYIRSKRYITRSEIVWSSTTESKTIPFPKLLLLKHVFSYKTITV